LNRASAVVVSFDDTTTALGVIALVHKHAPTVPVLVRTRDEHDMVLLKQAGAHEVIPDAFEVSLSLATHTLAILGVPDEKINQLVFIQRHTQYAGLKETTSLASDKP
jgi:CPA2 family monovalent cation:H+ antiporter-2